MIQIFLLVLAVLLSLGAQPQQPKDRSITSDDFNKPRPQPKKRTSQVKKQKRTYRLASTPLAEPLDKDSPNTLKAGVTLWLVERVSDGHGTREVAKRVEADTQFHEGDSLRLTIESPRSGFLYVVDRDWFIDGSAGGQTNSAAIPAGKSMIL